MALLSSHMLDSKVRVGMRVRKCYAECCRSTLLLRPETLLRGHSWSQSGYFWILRYSNSHFSAPCPHSHFNFHFLAGIFGVHYLNGFKET